jgi:ribonuclease III
MQRSITRAEIESFLGISIQDISLYMTAFVHKSALKEFPHLGDSYERMEFIGDSVVNFVVGKYLFDKYRTKKEGFLTRIRTKLVSGKCLSEMSKKLGLHRYVFMDTKGLRNAWNENDRICEDVFEALVGAVYLDLGMISAREFVIGCIERFVDFNEITRDTNFKDIVMRWTQANGMPLPEYTAREIRENGARVFEVNCFLNGTNSGRARAYNKKDAEQLAARGALLYYNVDIDFCEIE